MIFILLTLHYLCEYHSFYSIEIEELTAMDSVQNYCL